MSNDENSNVTRLIEASTGQLYIIVPDSVIGEVSDGFHTFNDLYHHRAVLFNALCSSFPTLAWKSLRHHDGSMYDGMFIVGMKLPTGDVTYHFDVDPYWDLFTANELPYAPQWDGHTPSDVANRIQAFGWGLSSL